MKKISIFALVMILTVSLTGCWGRNQEATTAPSSSAPMPSSSAPSTATSTAPTAPSSYATIPDSGVGGETGEGLLPNMDGSTGQTDGGTGNAGDNQRGGMPRY